MYLPSALSICSLKRNLIFQVEKKCKAIYAYLYTLGKIVPRTFSEAIINSFSKYFEEKMKASKKKKNSIFVFCSPTGSQLQVILLPRGCFATRDIFVYHSSGWRRGHCWHRVEAETGVSATALQFTGQSSPIVNYPSQRVISVQGEKP